MTRKAIQRGGIFLSLVVLFTIVAAAQTPASSNPSMTIESSGGTEPVLASVRTEIKRGSYAKAEAELHRWLPIHPDSSAGHVLLGYVLYRENKPKESLAEYTTAARRQKPNADDLAVVAMDYVLLADYADADKWLTKATEWDPGNPLYWYYLGRTKYSENRFQEAITDFQRTLKLHPRDVRAECNLGLSFAGLGKVGDAMMAYEKAIEWEKNGANKNPQPYLDLGMLLMRQEKPEQAAPYLVKAANLDPANPKVREALGRNFEEQGKLGNAESEYKAAIALAPDIAALHFELGRVYQKEKFNQLARKEFDKCAALSKTHSADSTETPNITVPPRHF